MTSEPHPGEASLRLQDLESAEVQRKEALETLRKSEERYRTILQGIEDGYYEVDIAGNLTFFNDSVCELLGYFREDLMGMNSRQYTDEESGKKLYRAFNEVFLTGRPTKAFNWEVTRKDGSKRFLEVSVTLMKDTTGKPVGFRGIARDLTHRKRAEEELLLQARLQRLLMEMATTYIGVPFDAVDLTIDRSLHDLGCFVGADRAYVFTYDYQRKICTNTHEWCSGGTPSQREQLQAVPLPAMPEWVATHQRGEPMYIPDAHALKPGGLRDVLEPQGIKSLLAVPMMAGQDCVGFVGFDSVHHYQVYTENERNLLTVFAQMLVNVDQRKRAEEALRESEERFRHLVEDAPFGLSLMHPDRTFEFFNQQFTKILGYTLEDLPDKDTWFLKAYPDPQYREQVVSAWKADLGEGVKAGEIKPRIFKVRCKDGRDKMMHFRAVPLKDGRQVLTYEDITERKRAEEEREKLQAQLNQAQKMESVGRLAGGVAHDFNNMLQAILGHTDLALGQVKHGQPLFDDLQEIRKAAERSGDLVCRLLAFARKQTISPKLLDLNDTVEGMLKMLRRLIGEDIDLAWLPGHGLWSVKVDPGQIDQILANLAVNARDAIEGVGKLTIETGNASLDEDYCGEHAGFVPGEYVLLAVSDNGIGMGKEILEHLFEPFFTTKEVGKGTGLGLATVYGIVKQNNGFINVYSEPGHGTTVKIYLPPHKAQAERDLKEGVVETAVGGNETILLVEDDPAILNLTRTMLERLGYVVVHARTPGEAIRLAGEHRGEFHLLMTDVIMPEMNGRDLAGNLLSFYPDLKHLFMSGYTADVIAHHGVLEERVHFLQKPFSMKDLAGRVREALDNE